MTSKFRTLALGVVLASVLPAALAHGPHGGYRGGYHGGYYGGYYGGYHRGDYWLGPALIGGAILGTTIYLSRPVQPSTVIVTSPPTVLVNGAPAQAPVEAYYCRDTGQYFPMAQTCPTPWLVVNTQ